MRNLQNRKEPAEELKEKSKERLRVFALYLILAMVIVLLFWMNGETRFISDGRVCIHSTTKTTGT